MPFLKAGMGAFKMLKGVAKGKLYRFRHLDEMCNCFVAGTMVTVAAEGNPATGAGEPLSSPAASQAGWAVESAAAGSAGSSGGGRSPGLGFDSKPIECVEVGDVVLTRSDRNAVSVPRPGRVTAVFRAVAPAILWLGLSSGEVLGTTPGHEVWTVEQGWTSAAYVRPGDTFVDPTGAPVTIESATLDEHPTPVYNLEVDGTFTYYADGVWVHNNSCEVLRRKGLVSNAAGHSFEFAVREIHAIPKYNGGKLSHGGVNFVPDFLDGNVIGDIKSSTYVTKTPQLEAIAGYARENGLRAVLYVADDVSSWVRKNFEVVVVP